MRGCAVADPFEVILTTYLTGSFRKWTESGFTRWYERSHAAWLERHEAGAMELERRREAEPPTRSTCYLPNASGGRQGASEGEEHKFLVFI